MADQRLIEDLRRSLHPLAGAASDYDPLLERVGEARVVLLGEASHGTHEFYRERAAITKRLIAEKGFGAVVVEADWPDAGRVDGYVRGRPGDEEAVDALEGFKRFPVWMWRNADVLDFVGWLRDHNDAGEEGGRARFFGMDLYSLHASMQAVLRYLERVDAAAARRARERYACFDHFGEDPQAYGYATSFGLSEGCQDDVVATLVDMTRRAMDYARRDGLGAMDAFFEAEQNARLVRDAEGYYRSMFGGRASSWNLRDQHMTDTLQAVVSHLERTGRSSRVVVWAHNSHLGDARFTEMGAGGEVNVGQLARERFGRDAVVNVGFTTHSGTVTAASEWDAPAERKQVRPSLEKSYERLFHEVGVPRFLLLLGDDAPAGLREPRLERAIGVIYRPESERVSHYFEARLPQQFDAVLHFDLTRAVEPLERRAPAAAEELAETYPSGI